MIRTENRGKRFQLGKITRRLGRPRYGTEDATLLVRGAAEIQGENIHIVMTPPRYRLSGFSEDQATVGVGIFHAVDGDPVAAVKVKIQLVIDHRSSVLRRAFCGKVHTFQHPGCQ